MAARTTWSGPGEGERLWFVGTLATIRVAGETVEDRFALIEFLFPQYASPPRHTHPQDESYVVLEGRLTMDSETARVLVLSTPAGLERMVRDVSVPASAATLPPVDAPRPEPAELQRLFEAHGQVNVGPPLARGD